MWEQSYKKGECGWLRETERAVEGMGISSGVRQTRKKKVPKEWKKAKAFGESSVESILASPGQAEMRSRRQDTVQYWNEPTAGSKEEQWLVGYQTNGTLDDRTRIVPGNRFPGPYRAPSLDTRNRILSKHTRIFFRLQPTYL
jgi:hypothetical protein